MVKIIADTLSCISVEEARELGLAYIPQIIEFDGQSFRDDTEMDSATFLARLRSSPILPKTAAPPPALYSPYYQEYVQQGHSILVIAPSGKMSGTVRGAEVAAQDFPDADIRVIDTCSVGSGLGVIVRSALEWANQGMDADTIQAKVSALAARETIYFMVATLEFLQRGGRIGRAQALVGSLLQLKPILTVNEGTTEAVENQRTKKRAIARIVELIMESCPKGKESHLSLMHGDALEDVTALAAELKPALGITDIPIYFVPPAILVHTGPGVLGVSFFRKEI
jgi:DegV family protein with EDD domain